MDNVLFRDTCIYGKIIYSNTSFVWIKYGIIQNIIIKNKINKSCLIERLR